MKKRNVLIAVTTLALFFISCKKDDVNPGDTPAPVAGVYVLNQGLYGANNTTLTFYDFSTGAATTDFYKNINGSGLGDTGNDMLIYGSKLYIVMNVSSYLEVAEAATARSLKKIEMKNPLSQPLTPRSIVFYKNNVFVSCWDGSVQVIDTTTLEITGTIQVGANPEQMVVSGDNLYVANSGGITLDYDSTVSVIDLNTLTETSKIVVGTNPTTITADNSGNLYVGYAGNYNDIKPGLAKVSTSSNSVIKNSDTEVTGLHFYNNKLYAIAGSFGAQKMSILSDADLAVSATFITDGTAVTTPYGFGIDESNGDIYVTDAVDYQSPGVVFCFDKTGKKKFSFSVNPGINPFKVAIIN